MFPAHSVAGHGGVIYCWFWGALSVAGGVDLDVGTPIQDIIGRLKKRYKIPSI